MACGGCNSGKTYTLQFMNKVAHDATLYSFEFKALESFEWQEGHSAEVFMTLDGEMVGEKFPFVTLPEEKVITFMTRIDDLKTDYQDQWSHLESGDLVEISEPEGSFGLQRIDRPALILSDGRGMPAVRSLVKTFEKDQEGIVKLTQINVDGQLELFKEEFDAIKQSTTGFKSIYLTDRNRFYQQVDFESQSLMIDAGFVPFFYIVGSEEFVLDVTAYLMSVGFDQADIITDGQSVESGCGGCSGGGCSGCSDKG